MTGKAEPGTLLKPPSGSRYSGSRHNDPQKSQKDGNLFSFQRRICLPSNETKD